MMDEKGRITTHYPHCPDYNPDKDKPTKVEDTVLGRIYHCNNFKYDETKDSDGFYSKGQHCHVCVKYKSKSGDDNKVKAKTLKYFDLFPLLKKLEAQRPGIKDRVWDFMCDEKDSSFKPYNGRISNINLFYYGAGDEYPLKYHKEYPDELEHCKRQHPHAFISGSKEETLRLDFNLIWYTYEDEGVDIEMFPVIVRW